MVLVSAFNSLFEMLGQVFLMEPLNYRQVSFNSLFEMPCTPQTPGRLSAQLSILYLRCLKRGRRKVVDVSRTFNSLFEMHDKITMRLVPASEPFNSLFEMRQLFAASWRGVARSLSILYLRCLPRPGRGDALRRVYTFNSLFEMRLRVASPPLR